MESEITLYKLSEEKPRYVNIVFSLILTVGLLAVLCILIYLVFTNKNPFKILISIIVFLLISVFFNASVK
ncbi:hypothetical protein, partial [Chryseobacterium joostei]